MEALTAILSLFAKSAGVPAVVTIFIAVFMGIVVIWNSSRKIDVSALVSVGEIQSKQIQDLQTLIRALTNELAEAREEITQISHQNTEMRRHIAKLEDILISNGLTPPKKPGDDKKGGDPPPIVPA